MKLRLLKQRNQAWTVIDMVVVIAVIVILAAILLPVIAAAKRRAQRINCLSNLNQINTAFQCWQLDLAFRAWEAEGTNHFNALQVPTSVSATNSRVAELPVITTAAGVTNSAIITNAVEYFQVRSNEFSAPKVLICPADMKRFPATNFQNDFNGSHISYFVNVDASESYPQEVMLGDDNLAINGVVVKSGLLELSTNAQVSFTADRHRYVGNIGYADGSVVEVSSLGLQSSLILSTNGTPDTISRLAIP